MITLRAEDKCPNYRWGEGRIDPDTVWGKEFGFTSDKFEGWLWKKRDFIIISFIEAKQPGKGHFRDLINTIKKCRFVPVVPTPMRGMEEILRHWGWQPRYIGDKLFGTVEVWSENAENVADLEDETPNIKKP